MASLNYLWSNRAKFNLSDLRYYKAWAKRFLCMPEIIKRNRTRTRLIRQGSSIHPSAEIGNVTINGKRENLTIQSDTFLGSVTISLFEEVIIGKNVCINDGVQILTASHDVNDPHWNHVKHKVIIEDYAWIAVSAIILPGVHIGKGAVIGAGAVVSKNVKAGHIVVGNPAMPVSNVRSEVLDYNPCEFLAGNRAWLIG